ncbi:hypothetical protein HK097_010099 [Rhizophlyctis rosea]|uniref:Uncharacterized protein n=1 Tax=Rhizophlyctis rosea TaxID=64517 RepID=A0AAD5SIW4_9FUNG|nr:hypothetical protein HK097_010099 [Rhizophlyctis rosea]
MLMYSFAWTTESEDEDEDSEAESVESDLSQPESVAPSGLLMALPIELLSEVFTLCLITSKFKGWTTLLLLSKACHAELLYNPMVLRRTLPLVYGGVFPTLSKLIYCRTRIRSDRQQTLCRIIDGVASGIRYDAKDVHAQIKRLSFFPVHLDLKELPNLAMMKLAADISANTSYIVNSITFGYLTDHMRSIRNTRNVEYQR